jgi:hypothetical protein
MTAKFRAVAGSDIRVGMTVSLKPDQKPFKVTKVEPWETSDKWMYIYGEGHTPEGVSSKNQWYAEVIGS